MGKPLKSAVIDIFGQDRVDEAFERAASAPAIGLDILAKGERALGEGPEAAREWLAGLEGPMADSFLVTACVGAVAPRNALNARKKPAVRMTLTIDSEVLDELDV
ncbi:MAG: hypothetical protein JJ974_13190, partial [Phycisphaerales bacterium]|nr:hypothetical protein [Phycisphaerales bacterium]